MKILFVNAPWYKENCYGVRAGSRWPHFEKLPEDPGEARPYIPFPFFMGYAAAVLKKAGHEVHVIDAIALGLDEKAFLSQVKEISPDVLVEEVSTPSIEADIYYAESVKKICGGTKIVFCGPNHLMYEENFLKENRIVDFAIYGEYENTLLKLIEQMMHNAPSLDSVQGLIYRRSGDIIKNPPAPLIHDIDSLPWPARELYSMEKYRDAVGGLPLPSLQIWASRGCPFHCNFCLWPQMMYGGRNYRARDPKDVAEEISFCVKRWNYKSFYFDDDTFNIGKERVIRLAGEIKKKKIELPFAVMARADTMDEEQLLALKSAGLYSIKYGVESGTQRIVNDCGKALDLKKVEKIVELTKHHGIKVHLTFTFGLPGETQDTIDKTIAFALKLDPDTVQFSIITPFPGSEYYRELDKKGYIISKNWEDYTGYTKAVIRTENLQPHELEEALRKANRAWRIHRHLKDREFKGGPLLRKAASFSKKKKIFLLYSSFSEHLDEILQTLQDKVDLSKLSLIVTANKKEEADKYFPGRKKIILGEDRFSVQNLSSRFHLKDESCFLIPVSNCIGVGYEEILKFFKDKYPKDHLAVAVNGKILK